MGITVSIICCTYNQEKTIAQAIDSFLNQKCIYSYEIIIGEDCGEDKTRGICISYQQIYPNKVKLILQENNKGFLRNYYDCLNLASGKYIAVCSGDDYWHNPNKLQIQIDVLEQDSTIGIVHTDFNRLDVQTGKITKSVNTTNNKRIANGYVIRELYSNYDIVAPTVCFRSSVFFKHVPFNKFIEIDSPKEDWPSNVIMAKYSKVKYLPVSTATYRVGQPSITNIRDYKKAENYLDRGEALNKFLCDLLPGDLKFDQKSQQSYKFKSLLNIAYQNKDFYAASEYRKKLTENHFMSKKVFFSKNRFFFFLFNSLKTFKK